MANKPNQRKAYTAHNKRVERYAALVDDIYTCSAAEFSKLALLVNHDPNKPFSWSNYPQTKRKVDQLLRNMANNIQGVVVSGVTAEWGESNFKSDKLARSMIGIKDFNKDENGRDIIPKQFKPYFNNNADALQSFITRKQKGLNLSQKLWKLTDQYKSDLELALSIGLSDGRSAAELSRDVRQYLNEPTKLFRRIRNSNGNLKLSKAANAYHPGVGTYRSSYKNAMRLTRTEVNMAYRTAESERYKQMDFVVGFEVKRSGRGYDCSVCESLTGKYPKDFKFVGWHPHCRCYVIPILKTDDEFWAWDGRGEVPASSINEVKDVPQGYKTWTDKNSDRIAQADKNGTLPYFLRDNKRYSQTTIVDSASSTLDDFIQLMSKAKIDYNKVELLPRKLAEVDIITRVGGGDLTKGSCSSLAFTYAGNKCGLNVLDFRDGASRQMFSMSGTVMNIAEKVGGVVSKNANDFANAKTLLTNVKAGKEYYFTCGAHAAIVRKMPMGYEYLELQSATNNGFKPISNDVLKYRFGAKKSHTLYGTKYEVSGCIIDIELLKNNTGFQKMLGYINTNESKQRKGQKGAMK